MSEFDGEKYSIEKYDYVRQELIEYYTRRDDYLVDKTAMNELFLRNSLESLYFSLKGYMALGYLNQNTFDMMIEYFEDEVNEV